jgi:predicted PurR-regulated permease PerM
MAIMKAGLRSGKSLLRREKDGKGKADLGQQGLPIDRTHPFYFGFLAALGAVIAITLLRAFASASQVLILIVISLFLAAGLNPAVNFFQRRGLSRGGAVGAIVVIVLAVVGLFSWIVIPPTVKQVNDLLNNAPTLVSNLKNNPTLAHLNSHYGIIDAITKKVSSSIKDGQLVISAFGGVIGVGKAVISGVISALTILVLTLYFLASLPSVTRTAYRFIPASRRDRVAKLTDAIIFRIGAFVGSQATVALIAAIVMLITGLIIHIPYATALAMVVFFCGLIPLIGHPLGIIIVTIVSLTHSPFTALISFLVYVIYVQIENYLIMPRIMKQSLSIPGLVTIIAALLGTSLLGLVGGLLAVPIAAAILLIVEEVVYPRADAN